jgi:hypothetical protein
VKSKTESDDLDKISRELARRFPQQDEYRCHFDDLLSNFASSGLADSHFIGEVTCGDDGKFWSRAWEAMLYRHLVTLRFEFRKVSVTKSGQPGPDFGLIHEGHTIWIEAVTPEPKNIPPDWLEPPKLGEVKRGRKPHEAMLVRWTSVLYDKRDKIRSYVEKAIIAPTDCTVIAVNSCRLYDFAVNDLGISGWPFAAEAVFPLGPLAVPITPDGKPDGEPQSKLRHEIRKHNGAYIRTDNFLDLPFANVSAIIGCFKKDMVDGRLPLTVVHNPLATVQLPKKILGASKEYVTDDKGDHYVLRQLS